MKNITTNKEKWREIKRNERKGTTHEKNEKKWAKMNNKWT